MRHFFPALLAAALGLTAAAFGQTGEERCYGVAKAGENDGIGEADAPSGATLDWQGDAWAWTPADACLTIAPPPQPDGTPRRGSYEPLSRDLPQ